MSLEPLLAAPFAIQLHAIAAVTAMGLGALILFRPKGTALHKALGRLWAGLMLVVATSALFINEIRLTYAGIGFGIWEIRHGRVEAHQAAMKSTYLGALLLTGAFTLLPGRRMHDVLFGAESGWLPSLIAIPLTLAVTAWLWRRLLPRRPSRSAAS
jgi:uncharacterized membrane protein